MKTAKKIIIYGICSLLIMATSILGTLAYLTDSDTVVNTFTMGKVEIILDETPVDVNGQPLSTFSGNRADRVKENEYHMIPGQTYVKDPTVTVLKGSAESYVRMIVELNCYDKLLEIFENDFLPERFVDGWDTDVWVSTEKVDVSDDKTTAKYEFRYHETVAPSEDDDLVLDALFDTFTVPSTLDGEDLKKLEGFKITVIGHAIQAGSFTDDAGVADEDAAWAAFDAQVASQNNQNATPAP